MLGYYKYTDFFIKNVNFIAGTHIPLQHIILPIGISFFTFQLIAFLVDSFRGETKNYDIIDYLLFITFFPQLIVGPIIHHAEIVPQFEDKKNWAPRLCRKLYGAQGVYWTIRSKEDLETAEREGAIAIFERFIP